MGDGWAEFGIGPTVSLEARGYVNKANTRFP